MDDVNRKKPTAQMVVAGRLVLRVAGPRSLMSLYSLTNNDLTARRKPSSLQWGQLVSVSYGLVLGAL